MEMGTHVLNVAYVPPLPNKFEKLRKRVKTTAKS